MSAEPPLPALMTLLPRRRFAFLHPLLLSLYIPLFLFAHNFYQVYPSELLLPSVLFLSVGLIVFLIMRLIVGNWPKSAVLSTVVLFFLFFYGIILTEDTRKIITGVLSGHALLSLLVALLAVLASGIALFRWMRAHQGHTLRTLLRTHKGMLVFLVCSAIGVVGLRAFLASQDLPALASKSPIHTFHLVPLSIWLVLGVCCIYAFARIKNDVAVNRWMNIFTLVLILLSLGQIVYAAVSFHADTVASNNSTGASTVRLADLPDIYYIIPDEYAGNDTLRKMYNFTNEEFLGWLREEHFYVVSNSYSNYNKTILSIPSSLNMNYVENLIDTDDPEKAYKLLFQLTENNLVVKTLKNNHYTYIHIGTRSSLAGKNANADVYISYQGLSYFNELVMESTILRAYSVPAQMFYFGAFDKILDMDASPKFVFTYMPVPHSPLIYDRDGNILPADQWYNYDNYFGQLLYVNKKLKEIINSLITKTKRPLVIIIQSDHGFRFCDLVSAPLSDCSTVSGQNNINAYYFSDGDYSGLYENITPVNSFRVVFNKYLKTNYSLLPDRIDLNGTRTSDDD